MNILSAASMNESQNGRGRLLKNDVQMVKRVSTKSIHKSLLSNVATWGYMGTKSPLWTKWSRKWMFLEKGTRWQKNGSVKLYGPFFVDGVQLPQGYSATTGRQFTFYQHVPRNSWYSFDRPWKDERLSRPWSYQVGLNMGPLNWKSSALTSYTFFENFWVFFL